MRIILASDLHLSNAEKLGRINEQGVNSRLTDKLVCFQNSIDYAIENDVDYYIFLGDAFEKLNPPENLRLAFLSGVAQLLKAGIKFIKIIGNHVTDGEIYNLKSDNELLKNLLKEEQFMIIEEPTVLEYSDFNFVFVPYASNEKIVNFLQNFQPAQNRKNLLFGHFGVVGAKLLRYEGSYSTKGISSELLRQFDQCFLGHYHLHQQIGNIVYVGSIAKSDFGDLEFGEDTHGFIDLILGEDPYWKLIKSGDRPFQQFEIIEETLDIDTALFKIPIKQDAIVKIVLTGTREWILELNQKRIQDEIEKKGAWKIFIETNIIQRDKIEDEIISLKTPFEEDVKHVAAGNAELEGVMINILKDVIEQTEF